jgi:hypothetical protein
LQVTVIKTKNAKGQKATPTAVSYTCKGDIVAACDDGTIKIYDGFFFFFFYQDQ